MDIKQQPLELIAEEDEISSTSTDSDITENDNEVYSIEGHFDIDSLYEK